MLTEKQLTIRRQHIGASESPAICGVSPWQTAADIYWRKVSDIADDEPNEAMMTGHRLEKPLIEFACEEFNLAGLRRNQFRVSKDEPLLSATFDALGDGVAVECKYVSAAGAQHWGEPYTDEVPDHVLVQAQHQAFVANLKEVIVAAAIAGPRLEWRIYRVPRHEKLIEAIVTRCVAFWRDHVQPRVPPTDAPPPLDILAKRTRVSKAVQITNVEAIALRDRILELQSQRDVLEQEIELCKRQLIDMLGDADCGVLLDGSHVTYYEQTRRMIDQRELRKRYPDIARELEKETRFRVFRIKELKNEQEKRTGDT